MASQQDALSQLAELTDAGSGRSLVELGWIQQLRLEGSRAVFRLALPGFAQSQRDSIAAEARSRLEALDGIDSVQIELAQPGEEPQSAQPAMAKVSRANRSRALNR